MTFSMMNNFHKHLCKSHTQVSEQEILCVNNAYHINSVCMCACMHVKMVWNMVLWNWKD